MLNPETRGAERGIESQERLQELQEGKQVLLSVVESLESK